MRRGDFAAGGRGSTTEDGHDVPDGGAGYGVVKKMNCQEVLDQLSDFLEEDVALELRSQIESHLNGCRHCHLEVDTLRRTVQLFRSDEAIGTPIALSDRLKSALAAAYRERGCADAGQD
jgi:hypothetical protein